MSVSTILTSLGPVKGYEMIHTRHVCVCMRFECRTKLRVVVEPALFKVQRDSRVFSHRQTALDESRGSLNQMNGVISRKRLSPDALIDTRAAIMTIGALEAASSWTRRSSRVRQTRKAAVA